MIALEFYTMNLDIIQCSYNEGKITHNDYLIFRFRLKQKVQEMAEQELKDAYKHGRDDENCALSDGAMRPDYENADEWYKGEYGGEQ